MGLFEAAHAWVGGGEIPSPPPPPPPPPPPHPLPKLCHIYLTMIKLGTLIPYIKNMQKYKSRTFLQICIKANGTHLKHYL